MRKGCSIKSPWVEGGEDGNGKEGREIPGGWERVKTACMANYMQMTSFYVVSWRRT